MSVSLVGSIAEEFGLCLGSSCCGDKSFELIHMLRGNDQRRV
jgi:hypothetical protein